LIQSQIQKNKSFLEGYFLIHNTNLVDLQRIVPDDEIKKQVAKLHPYQDWINSSSMNLEAWTKLTKQSLTNSDQ